MDNIDRINLLEKEADLQDGELKTLISTFSVSDRRYAAERARAVAISNYGRRIFFRGLIELSNYCKNNCYYCGIRRGNPNVERYRMDEAGVMSCCEQGYALGFRTFVMQGGEDDYFTDERMVKIVGGIRKKYPDCAITLSLGERGRESFQRLFDAGADRYLLRHETASPVHYSKLHPAELSFPHRMKCLEDLKEIGYQTGCGMMVGSPFQTVDDIVADLRFMKDFGPQMIGLGPFIPHKDTPFHAYKAGTPEATLFLLSVARLMHPKVLLPATTALGTVQGDGREQGILAGANVIMPNITPAATRKNYLLYDNKIGTADDASESVARITRIVRDMGYEVVASRGDYGEGGR